MAKHVSSLTSFVRVAGLVGFVGAGAGLVGLEGQASGASAKSDTTIEVDAATRDKMTICTDGKSHYVAVAPHERLSKILYYSDKSLVFTPVPPEPHGVLPGTDFFEPRYPNKNANQNFRGVDMRNYSAVELNTEKQTCTATCGPRSIALTVMPADKAREILKKATFGLSPQKYIPYGLARDERGTYYYVDHGATEKTEKDYRLFVGPRGAMKPMKMTNMVSDSEGDIFSTATGSLRLILEKKQSLWVEGDKRNELKVVPVEPNLAMIYNDLGVYVGQRLGTPCDDL